MSTTSLPLYCPDADAMHACGAALGRAIAGLDTSATALPALLLLGEMGAGKTTFTRGLVQGMPGGGEAQVASPSFTLMNCYPTCPPVAHIDAYRLEPAMAVVAIPELLEEIFTTAAGIMVVMEWAQRLPAAYWPMPALAMQWQEAPAGRRMDLAALDIPPMQWSAFRTALAHWAPPSQ